uniref:Serine aminopeptidase S33 domain-containing protein n=1 Tax=Kalanchoe fedtschenkoi TaxID=63787 RepID=A0A7N0U8Q0_KALFE
MAYLADTLEKEGISAFHFDFAGNGESEGSFQFGNYRREAGDLHDVIQHFMRNQRIVAAVVGHSKGGNVVLLYASIYNDVRTVINISGRFNLENGIEARLGKGFQQRIRQNGYIDINNKRGKFIYRVTEESLMDRLTTDTLTSASSIPKDCWVLTIHGSRDEVVSPADALEFSKFIHNHQLHIIEGADHEYTSHQLELACVVLNFIRAGLMRESAIQEHSLGVSRL